MLNVNYPARYLVEGGPGFGGVPTVQVDETMAPLTLACMDDGTFAVVFGEWVMATAGTAGELLPYLTEYARAMDAFTAER